MIRIKSLLHFSAYRRSQCLHPIGSSIIGMICRPCDKRHLSMVMPEATEADHVPLAMEPNLLRSYSGFLTLGTL